MNDGITDALASELGIKSKFVKDLFSIFLDEAVFQPLAESLRNQGGGGGGGLFGSILGAVGKLFGGKSSGGNSGFSSAVSALSSFGITGLTSGGYAGPGSIHRVNEHAGGVELLRMGPQGGQVIPLGAVNAQASRNGGQSGGVTTVRLELSGDIDARIQQQSAGVAVEVYRAALPGTVEMAAQETTRRMTRPRMPGAGR